MRLDKEREMEELDRTGIIYKHEINKLVDMGNENLEYIANGENLIQYKLMKLQISLLVLPFYLSYIKQEKTFLVFRYIRRSFKF